jgi:hypothetical protein
MCAVVYVELGSTLGGECCLLECAALTSLAVASSLKLRDDSFHKACRIGCYSDW